MLKQLITLSISLTLCACVVLPVKDKEHVARCELSIDRKTLKVVNVAEETNSYYSIEGYMLSPILIPTSFILSASYVLVNNIYHHGQQKIHCVSDKQPPKD